MPRRLLAHFLGITLFLVAPVWVTAADPPAMRAHFINVGQGASTLLEFPCRAVLIDTGAQDEEHADHLADYLRDFFERRPDLNNTLSALYISHPHVDHTFGISRVTAVCRVANYIDNGAVAGSGETQVKWIRDQVSAGNLATKIRAINNDEVTALPQKHGLTDDTIDPIRCPTCDPKIVVLQSRINHNPGWSDPDFRDWNNHSLVLRVDFGASSFLFTGDLEDPAQQTLATYYHGTPMLDVDVYLTGHHGSSDGTGHLMTPKYAVIGVGRWDYGKDVHNEFATYAYGHPRKVIVDRLSNAIGGNRNSPKDVRVFTDARAPVLYQVKKNIYATGWDGDVVIKADLTGNYQVEMSNSPMVPTPLARRAKVIVPKESAVAFDSVVRTPAPVPLAKDDHRGMISLINRIEKVRGHVPNAVQNLRMTSASLV